MPTKREGRWDCKVCGTAGNLGRDKICPHCGAPRPEGTKFYLPKGEPPVSQPDLLRDANAGPDWICANCAASNAGYRVACSQCGALKPSDAHTQKVTDYNLQDVPRDGDRGPQEEKEWTCTNCGAHNPESRSVCSNCGVRRGESGSQKYNRESYGQPQKPRRVKEPEEPRKILPSVQLPEDRTWLYIGGAVAGILLFLCAIWFFFIRTVDTPLTITGFHWERSVNVQVFKTVTEEDWSIPVGGRETSHRSEIHHYDSVLDHYDTKYRTVCEQVSDGYDTESYEDCRSVATGSESYVCGERDLGNGYFEDIECSRTVYETQCDTRYRQVPKYRQDCRQESYQDPVYRQEPRYATKYTYEIEKWVYSRTPGINGDNHDPVWPNFTLEENEREAGRTERYVVFFIDEKVKEYSYEMGFDQWSQYELGQKVMAEINTIGQISKIKSK